MKGWCRGVCLSSSCAVLCFIFLSSSPSLKVNKQKEWGFFLVLCFFQMLSIFLKLSESIFHNKIELSITHLMVVCVSFFFWLLAIKLSICLSREMLVLWTILCAYLLIYRAFSIFFVVVFFRQQLDHPLSTVFQPFHSACIFANNIFFFLLFSSRQFT